MQDPKKGALSINKTYAEKVMTVEFDAQASLQKMTRASENMIYKVSPANEKSTLPGRSDFKSLHLQWYVKLPSLFYVLDHNM